MSKNLVSDILRKVIALTAFTWVCWMGNGRAAAQDSLGSKAFEFAADLRVLRVEVEDDQLLHFEYSEQVNKSFEFSLFSSRDKNEQIYSSPMVAKKTFSGPLNLEVNQNVIQTDRFVLTVSQPSLCLKVYDRALSEDLLSVCAEDLDKMNKTLVLHPHGLQNIYGMGNYFYEPTTADGDWSGKDWTAEGLGNFRHTFLGGAPSISQFPILYALGKGFKNVAVFVDNSRQISWNFRDPNRWTLSSPAESLRFYVITGPNLKSLRHQFMDLVGKPLIPPKSTFGLWVSKFGYGSWDEIKEELSGLRQSGFPLDGFALDIQWFGGRFDVPSIGRMGSLSFDQKTFPSPEREIARFREAEGIRFLAIEESYVDERLPEYLSLKGSTSGSCYLARLSYSGCEPIQLGSDQHPLWWGRGGMIDWTHPDASRFWHQQKRMPLAQMGIQHHWTDLGEPEMYNGQAFYHGIEPGKIRHWDIHNLYNLMWSQGIYEGYNDSQNQKVLQSSLGLSDPPRHFSMSRAGAPGLQRFGAGMWSGDIGRNAGSLRAHLNTQLHMSLAGVDYYNSDVGGFSSTGDSGSEPGHNDSELYTQWFANSALSEIPLRTHGWAYEEKGVSFSPNRRGDIASNRANLLRRYELSPYLYSLAHSAYLLGDPIFPPLVYEFQDDLRVRQLGNEKMIGDSLLFGVVVGFGQKSRPIYLPRGTWVNYDTHEWFESKGEETQPIPLYRDLDGKSVFTLPLFARAGAILPKRVPKLDLDRLGKPHLPSLSEKSPMDLVFRIVSSPLPSSFTYYEDDGETLAYQRGKLHSTEITQVLRKTESNKNQQIAISATLGDYVGATESRVVSIELLVNQEQAVSASLNGQLLTHCISEKEWNQNTQGCWWNAEKNLIRVKSESLNIRRAKIFQIDFI